MKKVEHYICDICHTEYNDKMTCQNCEKSHRFPTGSKGTKHIPFTQTGYSMNGNYPVWIDIEFDDGKVLRYKR